MTTLEKNQEKSELTKLPQEEVEEHRDVRMF